ncbi:MAG: universal stress protein [Pseudomonadota bacterium]
MAGKTLVPIDLSDMETSSKVLAAGVSHARQDGSSLVVMSVVPHMISGIDYRYAIRGETGGSEEFDAKAIVQETLERLNEVVSEQLPNDMKAETIVRHGSVYERILEVAEEIEPDQIVIGAHRPQLADYLLGPNTARVVRHAKCSVNVVRTQ